MLMSSYLNSVNHFKNKIEIQRYKFEGGKENINFCFLMFQRLESLAGKLCRKYPEKAESIKTKQKEADENWEKLEDLSDKRSLL